MAHTLEFVLNFVKRNSETVSPKQIIIIISIYEFKNLKNIQKIKINKIKLYLKKNS